MSQTIPLTGVDSLLDGLDDDIEIVCVELAEGATPLPVLLTKRLPIAHNMWFMYRQLVV